MKCPHRWQPSKTDAEGTCYEYACWRCGGTKRTLYGAVDAAAEAAARAVDEALSVERVREVLHRGGWGVPAGGCIQHSFTTARDGVTCVREDTTADTCEHASVHSTFAADLVAHLRGPRP